MNKSYSQSSGDTAENRGRTNKEVNKKIHVNFSSVRNTEGKINGHQEGKNEVGSDINTILRIL